MLEDKNGPIKRSKTVARIEHIEEKFLDYIGFPMFPIIGLASIIIGVWLGSQEKTVVGFMVIFLYCAIPGIVLLTAGIAWISCNYRKVEIRGDGLWIKYPLEALKKISWDEFQEVCVCYAGHHDGHAHSVICCVKKGEKENVFTGRWKTMNPYKHRSVITMDYTDELYDEFKEKCPYPVKDLRNTRRYKIY